MEDLYGLRIDVYPHILPPRYREAVAKVLPAGSYWLNMAETSPTLSDLDARFRIMDKYGMQEIVVLVSPGVEDIAGPEKSVDLARIANDEMAELVYKYPDRFLAAVACLPMNNMDAALRELERAVNDLRFRGAQIWTSINDKPLDSPEFMPLYEEMATRYDLPIWLHPRRSVDFADYRTLKESKYNIWHTFGWPYETTAAMTHLVFGGVLEKHPNLKFITHHCGAMVPYFAQRIISEHNMFEMRRGKKYKQGLRKEPIEYYRMFYNDTALYGHTPGLMLAHDFFGADHILFGTDMPQDSQSGPVFCRDTINAIAGMNIPDEEKTMIFEGNARRLLRLPI